MQLVDLSNYFSSVVAEMVYCILVEARNCVEFSIFPRLWPSLCILLWWRPEIVSNYLSSVVAEFVYFILVEARNCVELFFPRLWPSLCSILVEARNCVELFFLGCG